MSVARITTINFKNKEDADKSIEDYSEKAPSEFPEKASFAASSLSSRFSLRS